MCTVGSHQIYAPRDDEGEDLFARPQGFGLQDSGLGHVAIPAGQKHEQIHHLTLQDRGS